MGVSEHSQPLTPSSACTRATRGGICLPPFRSGSPASCSDQNNVDGVVSEAFKASFKMTGSFYFCSQMHRLHAIKKSRSTTEGRGAPWRDTLEDEGRPETSQPRLSSQLDGGVRTAELGRGATEPMEPGATVSHCGKPLTWFRLSY